MYGVICKIVYGLVISSGGTARQILSVAWLVTEIYQADSTCIESDGLHEALLFNYICSQVLAGAVKVAKA